MWPRIDAIFWRLHIVHTYSLHVYVFVYVATGSVRLSARLGVAKCRNESTVCQKSGYACESKVVGPQLEISVSVCVKMCVLVLLLLFLFVFLNERAISSGGCGATSVQP